MFQEVITAKEGILLRKCNKTIFIVNIFLKLIFLGIKLNSHDKKILNCIVIKGRFINIYKCNKSF